ncbi:MAG: hypothetical protein ACREVE_05415 [Gammaproteobacteria bacterium]
MSEFGISRLLLLNSANYELGLFPVDRPLSLFGPNNSGKTTAVNALQFLFLTDMREMRFGKYDSPTTRKYYFPDDRSYVLAEILLEHGTYVIAAAGKGVGAGYAYQHVVYQGGFNLAHYVEEGLVRDLRSVMLALQADGITPHRAEPEELRKLLMGIPTGHDLNLCMIPLKRKRDLDYKTFIEVFKNLIHMRDVKSDSMKRLLLSVFDTRLAAAKVDFAADYERAYAQVKLVEEEIKTLERIAPSVNELGQQHTQRQGLRGKLRAAFPCVRAALERWQVEYEQTREQAAQAESEMNNKLEVIAKEQQAVRGQRDAALETIGDATRWLKEQDDLARRFALVTGRDALVADLDCANNAYEHAVQLLGEAQSRTPKQIEDDIERTQTERRRIEVGLRYLDANVYSLLLKYYDKDEIAYVFRLFNDQILELPANSDGLLVDDSDMARRWFDDLLSRIDEAHCQGAGFTLALAPLEPPAINKLMSREQQQERLHELTSLLARLPEQLEAARDLGRKRAERQVLARGRDDARRYLEDYDGFGARQLQQATFEAGLKAAQQQRTALEARSTELEKSRGDAYKQRLVAQSAREDAERRNDLIKTLSAKARPLAPDEPQGESFLAALPETLDVLLAEYVDDLHTKDGLDGNITERLRFIEQTAGARYLRDSEESSTAALVEAVGALPQKRELLERQRRSAITDLGSTLKTLRDNYRRFEIEMDTFNRNINKRAISNLTRVVVRPAPHKHTLEAIEALVSSSEMDLLSIDEQTASEAARYLNRLVGERGSELGLVDLFDLNFVVFAQDERETVYKDLEQIESHGTTITIKALVNMHMMDQLLDRSPKTIVNIPYYIDEAAEIDPDNQQNLIAQGLDQGFVPILASVKPQINARYCISLAHAQPNGRHYIDQRDWTEIEAKQAAVTKRRAS